MLRRYGCALSVAALASWVLAVLAVSTCRQVAAAEVSAGPRTAPIARVAGDAHTALIKRLDVSADNRLALSVSDDKTGRVWDLTQPGVARPRLLRTLRIPIDEGYEGQLYTGALSPNGQIAALGGYTALTWDGAASIYFMATDTGRMIGRLHGLPGGGEATVETLKFSRDGRLLAATFWRSDGRFILQLYDLNRITEGPEKALVIQDDTLGGRTLGADFAPNGDLTIASMSGVIRRYAAASVYKRSATLRVDAALEALQVHYSPDGKFIAVGMNLQPRVAIIDAASMKLARWLALSPDAHQQGLQLAEWSPDGKQLFAAGEPEAGTKSRVYRWDLANPTSSDGAWVVANRRVTDLHRVEGGGLLFASADPGLGLMQPDGRIQWTVRSNSADMRHSSELFRVSADGRTVQFGLTPDATDIVAMTLDTLDETSFSRLQASRVDLATASRSVAGLRLDIRNHNRELWINDKAFALDDKEEAHSIAVAQDGSVAYAGSAWALRALRADGSIVWRTATNSPIYQLAVAEGAHLVVAGLGDGTVRWYRASDGIEIAAAYVSASPAPATGAEWIVWTPDGHYAASPQGDELIGWHVNRGADQEARFYRAVQFERVLYDPAAVLAALTSPGAARSANSSVAALASIMPPEIWLRPSATPAATPGALALDVVAETDTLPMTSLTAYVNDVPVLSSEARPIVASDARAFTRRIELPLSGPSNDIRVEISNGRAIGLGELWSAGATRSGGRRGTLFVLAVGVSRYEAPQLPNLTYASKDATDFEKQFAQASGALFDRVETRVLGDGGEVATSRNVRAALPFVSQAGPDDTVVLFLAAHGVSGPSGDYYFLPRDSASEDVASVLKGDPQRSNTLIAWTEFFDALSTAAGKRLLVVDTCHSANIRGVSQTFSLAKRSAASRFALLAASKGDELSQEMPGQGVFTHAVLAALKSAQANGPDDRVSLGDVYAYVLPEVDKLRPRKDLKQTPQLVAPRSLTQMPLAISRSNP